MRTVQEKISSIRLIFKKFYFKQEGNLSSLSARIWTTKEEKCSRCDLRVVEEPLIAPMSTLSADWKKPCPEVIVRSGSFHEKRTVGKGEVSPSGSTANLAASVLCGIVRSFCSAGVCLSGRAQRGHLFQDKHTPGSQNVFLSLILRDFLCSKKGQLTVANCPRFSVVCGVIF